MNEFVSQDFSEYTYQVSYKVALDTSEILLSEETRIIPAITSKIENGEVVATPHPDYNFFMNTLETYELPQDDVILIIRRNKVYEVDEESGARNEIADVEDIYEGSFNFLNYDTRSSILIEDSEIGDTKKYIILVQILNKNKTEKIPCKYVIDSIAFAGEVAVSQKVDLKYKQIDSDTWIDLGSDIETGTNGEIDKIDLGELPEDTEYLIHIYHHEKNEDIYSTFRTNIVPTIGENPIIGEVEWNGRQVVIDAPDVKARMYPSNKNVDWMFTMDYSTKSFDNIMSSLWSSIPDKYEFVMRQSYDEEKEIYIGCEVNRDIYYALPTDYYNPTLPNDGDGSNIYFKTLFNKTSNADERRTIFCKFFIDEDHVGDVRLFNFVDKLKKETFIGFKTLGDQVDFHAFGNDYPTSGSNRIIKNKWYNLILVCKEDIILYASITDKNSISQASLPINSGAIIGDVYAQGDYFSVDRKDFEVEVIYDATTVDEDNMGLSIEYATYQYDTFLAIDDKDIMPINNNIIDSGYTTPKVIVNGSNQSLKTTIKNEGGYGCKIGYSLRFMHGGVTSNGNVTIKDIKLNGISVMNRFSDEDLKIDAEVTEFMNGTYNSLNFIKTGDEISSPVGGLLFSNISTPTNIDPKAGVFLGGKNVIDSNYVIAKVGFKTVIIEGVDSWLNPYKYMDVEVYNTLGSGYKFMPYLRCTNELTDEITEIPTLEMSEIKDATVKFYLSGLPYGPTIIDVMSNGESIGSITRNIKSIKVSVEDAEYDIDFEAEDFDQTLVEFKKRYFAKQKRWGGNMGGGTNGNLIYFNRAEKCLILEQHGDLYDGIVPSVSPAGKEGYGFPADIIEAPLIYPKQTTQRTARVGGLIQSVDYHGYGMFDCWFNVPKGMMGLAICLWYFHYQEIYDYDREFEFWTKTGWNGFKYEESVESGFGATWVVINNEIDMELGSENTPYRTPLNPNDDRSISWYVHGLSYRQLIGCTSEDPSLYGTWLIDWDASLDKINSITSTDPKDPNAYVWTDELVWVKVNSKLDEVNYGANNRSVRFNNWVNERWNDGTGVYGSPEKSPLGGHEMSVNNRTPLGDIDPKALKENLRYIEKYYDDGQYHKWSIDWNKDQTRLLIDDEEIAILKAFVPFNPMTMLVGCWFPSGNVYDKGVMLGEYGTWGGVHAPWEYTLMKVKRIKFKPYTEEEAPTTQMRYDCETYGEDGLRKIL